MATLHQLDDSGALWKLDPDLPPGTQPGRIIYASPKLAKWMGETLPDLPSSLGLELSPHEQVGQLLEEFCGGEDLAVGPRFHSLRPDEKGVWELKTPEIRIFGWFYLRDYFIGTVANTANFIKDHDLYAGYINETADFRNALNLDPPKFIPGKDPYAVVSNFHHP